MTHREAELVPLQRPVDTKLDRLDDLEGELRRRWRFFALSLFLDLTLISSVVGTLTFMVGQTGWAWIFLVQIVVLGVILGIPSVRWKRALLETRRERDRLEREVDALLEAPPS